MTESLQEIERLMIAYGLECYAEGKTQLMADTQSKGAALMSAITRVVADRDAKTKRMWELGHECDKLTARIAVLEKALREALDFVGPPNTLVRLRRALSTAEEKP